MRGLQAVLDHIGQLLSNSVQRAGEMSTDLEWHDARVDNAQVGGIVHAQTTVNHTYNVERGQREDCQQIKQKI